MKEVEVSVVVVRFRKGTTVERSVDEGWRKKVKIRGNTNVIQVDLLGPIRRVGGLDTLYL